jgi:hypothetical protein
MSVGSIFLIITLILVVAPIVIPAIEERRKDLLATGTHADADQR